MSRLHFTEMTFAPGETKHLYFKLESSHNITPNFFVLSKSAYTMINIRGDATHYLYLGVVLMLIIYNILQYFSAEGCHLPNLYTACWYICPLQCNLFRFF